MAECKRFYPFFTGSSLVFCAVCSGIFYSYGTRFGVKAYHIAAAVCALTVILILPFVLYAQKRQGKIASSTNILLFALLAAFPVICGVAAYTHVCRLTQNTPFAPAQSVCTAKVLTVSNFRYKNEVVLSFAENRDILQSGRTHKGVAYTSKKIILEEGDIFQITGMPRPLHETADISTYESSMTKRGIFYSFFLDEKNVTVTEHAASSRSAAIRAAAYTRLCNLFDSETAPILQALYFGSAEYVNKKTTMEFKRAGVLHILAASGMHISVVAAIPLFFFSILCFNRKTSLALTAVVVFSYVYITVMPVSLMRAAIMFFVFAVSYFCDCEKNAINILMIAGSIMLLYFPADLFNLGFQLSFGATLGILLFEKRYRTVFRFLPKHIAGSLSVTISAQTFVWPIIVLELGEINITGLLTNIIAVPLSSLGIFSSLAALAASFAEVHVAALFAWITGMIFKLLTAFIGYCSTLNGHFVVPDLQWYFAPAFLLFLLPLVPKKFFEKTGIIAVCVAVLTLYVPLSAHNKTPQSEYVFFKSNPRLMLYRSGSEGTFYGELDSRDGIKKIERYALSSGMTSVTLIIQNPTRENISSCNMLIKKLSVKKCVISENFYLSEPLRRLIDTLEADHIPLEFSNFYSTPATCTIPAHTELTAQQTALIAMINTSMQQILPGSTLPEKISVTVL